MPNRILKRLSPLRSSCLFYWSPAGGGNFGDELSWHVVQRALELADGHSDQLNLCESGRRYRRRVFAIGSILHFSRPGDVVWGSGINGKVSAGRYDFTGVDFRAVRGPLSRQIVLQNGGACPPVYGDPGLLVPRLFPELLATDLARPKIPVSLVPNLNDQTLLRDHDHQEYHLISPLQDWRSVFADVVASEFVVSSSLHGIILADAMGIPCRPLLSLFESPLKYADYFLSTGREDVEYARTPAHALKLGPVPAPQIDLDALMRAFPAEVFRG